MTEFTKDDEEFYRKLYSELLDKSNDARSNVIYSRVLDFLDIIGQHRKEIERLQARVAELEIQLKSKDIIINNQQGRLNYYATKDLLGGKNEHG